MQERRLRRDEQPPTAESPLAGKRIVVTRATHQADQLSSLLLGRGAEPLLYPCIAIAPPEDTVPLDTALRAAAGGAFEWLVVTSSNTVQALAQRLETLGVSPSDLAKLRMAAVGPTTASAVRKLLGLSIQVAPDEYRVEALAEALRLPAGTRVLLPQSDIARPTLAQGLAAGGIAFTSVVAYRTVRGEGGVNLPALLAARHVDAITFTSSSTVDYFVIRLQAEGGKLEALAGVCLACIGQVTAVTAREQGLYVHVTSSEHTLEALVAELEGYFRG